MVEKVGAEVPFGNAAHPDLFKTLNLLSLDLANGVKAFFVVEGSQISFCWERHVQGLSPGNNAKYFFENYTCPINFIRIACISVDGNMDPHGLFDFVRAIWMPQQYVDLKKNIVKSNQLLLELFPELGDTHE